jgi:malate dehydrogenase (oxaloacetate-decarboxylating)
VSIYDDSLKLHEKYRGKLEVRSKIPVKSIKDLSEVYTPGVAAPCEVIRKTPGKIYSLTSKWNTVAVVTDGSAVLGLGNIGASAGLPVMEGKAVLFKELAGIDAFPVCIKSQDVNTIVDTVELISPPFGGINLEDISAPRCFEIEEKLKKRLDIPVFHDDQHGTAVVTLAGVINALKFVGKDIKEIKITMSGAGAAGIAIAKILLDVGAKNLIMCDRRGVIHEGRENLNRYKLGIARRTNKEMREGTVHDAIKGSDLFIGVSVANVLDEKDIKNMAKSPIVFAMANPEPEIAPEKAKKAGARVVCTGRSDYPNQINNVLGFPGIFRGALEARAPDITESMKLAAARALAGLIREDELAKDYVIPKPLDKRVVPAVAKAVAGAAKG